MKVLGIDPGLAITGYGLVEGNGELSLLACGVINTSGTDPLPTRLRKLYEELKSLVEKFCPDAVAVEELFFCRNVRTAIAVGQARGVALLAVAEAQVPLFEYTPLQVKQALTGYGRADKKQIQNMVSLLLGLKAPPKPDDVADAVAVAICHIHHSKMAALI
ncbi:MAG: crossover junction endodeoxyribonuclease RuvC [Chloroflexi bacterium]|nr:MAG: crossover junction endodeoxyribonuclease RuvC [Chloroflexota bacterium]HDN80176.1 crossover junction endodeoxyribonuclease RuvC [Chloroflexota bacterium]